VTAAPGKTAVVLYNLGGPLKPADVRPFLFNLFNDPMIMDVPGPLRWMLAQLISRRRARIARAIYGNIGGGSPLLKNTLDQAGALDAVLNADTPGAFSCHVAMRYWHPFWHETMDAVIAERPGRADSGDEGPRLAQGARQDPCGGCRGHRAVDFCAFEDRE
jgi:ferrochelatase